ncbi:MAG: WG repeat-containing protein [Bacteroidota bacterium]
MKKIIPVLLLICSLNAFGGKIASAYKALSVYDYFKAKGLLYASLSKNPAEAGYGLATIYYRTDNPFSNIDSAAKYIAKCAKSFKDTLTLSGFLIAPHTIHKLRDNISLKGFNTYSANLKETELNHFLQQFYFSHDTLLDSARLIRDQLYLNTSKAYASSDSVNLFLLNHPETELYADAQKKVYDFQYAEQTLHGNAIEYKHFIIRYPSNPNVSKAEDKLFELTKQLHSTDSLYSYITHYSKRTTEDAWKLLYSISVKDYSKKELKTFLDAYPGYPFRDDIEKEIHLSQKVLYVLKNTNDKYGYIDTLAKWIIKPVFDDATPFKEGFAGVCKNDSCYFINKEGIKTSASDFEETDNYINGLAIVKQHNYYYLVNRSGQLITQGFEDISPASDNVFVCKSHGLYGAINARAETVIPFSYKKLGNFKNGYAYYMADKYGLVNIYNKTLKAQWDWISEIDTNDLVIVKKELKFGLMNLDEKLLLTTEFDYISHCENGIYCVVKNGRYGFYNAIEKCYFTVVGYEYDKTLTNDYYTNGKQFKLIEEGEVALADVNGRFSIKFGTYTDVFFAKNDIIRIQKGKKFGYVDRKLKPITPAEYEKADDFENNVAIVLKGEAAQLINKSGKVLFTLKEGVIEKQEAGFYRTLVNELFGLINANGEVLLPNEFSELTPINGNLWRCTKNNELFLYKANRRQLIKITD